MACGHSCSARLMGIAERTPNLRAAYVQDETTPRSSGRPPTTIGCPRHSGCSSSSTDAKKASRSMHRIRRVLGAGLATGGFIGLERRAVVHETEYRQGTADSQYCSLSPVTSNLYGR